MHTVQLQWSEVWKQLSALNWRVRQAKVSTGERRTIYFRPNIKLGTGLENHDFFLSPEKVMEYIAANPQSLQPKLPPRLSKEIVPRTPGSTPRSSRRYELHDATAQCVVFDMSISLFCHRVPGYVGAKGFGDRRMNILKTSLDADDEASILQRHNFKDRVFKIIPAHQYTALAALNTKTNSSAWCKESIQLEMHLNEKNSQSLHGKGVKYGQAIQLVHQISNKFVTVKPRIVAETEHDAFQVELCEEGSVHSHFQIRCAYNHLRHGNQVYLYDDIVLWNEEWQVQLHVGLQVENQSELYELNAASSQDMFSIQPFTFPDQPDHCVCGGDIVRIAFSQTKNAYLTLPDEKLRLQSSSTQSLWQIQLVDIKDGRAITALDMVCLRHIASEQFLTFQNNQVVLCTERNQQSYFQCHNEIDDAFIQKENPFYLCHVDSGLFLGVVDNRIIGDTFSRNFAWKLEVVSNVQAMPYVQLLALVHELKGIKPIVQAFPSLPTHLILSETSRIQLIFLELIAFCLDKPKELIDMNSIDNDVNGFRQDLLGEMHCIAMLIDILKCPFKEWGGSIALDDCRHVKENDEQVSLALATLYNAIRGICQCAYILLFYMIKCHSNNITMLTDHLSVLIQQLGYDLKAECVLRTVFRTSEKYLLSLSNSVIEVFITAINKRGRKSYYLDFLALLCQYNDIGIPNKQDALCHHLFFPIGIPNPKRVKSTAVSLVEQITTSLDNPMSLNKTILYNMRCEQNANGLLGELEIQLPESDLWVNLFVLTQEERSHCQYFLSSLRLLTAMCSSRNYMCMYSIEQFFPKDVVLHIVQDLSLPKKIRAAFCQLLYVTYIDRLPYQDQQVPRSIVITTNTAMEALNLPSDGNDEFMTSVKGAIETTLKECKGVLTIENSPILLDLLRICLKLMKFGLYHDEKELAKLYIYLIPLLNDVEEPMENNMKSLNSVPRSRSRSKVHPVVPPTAENHSSSGEMDHCRKIMCQILTWTLKLSLDYQIQNLQDLLTSTPPTETKAKGKEKYAIATKRTQRQATKMKECNTSSTYEKILQSTLFERLTAHRNIIKIVIGLLQSDSFDLVAEALEFLRIYDNRFQLVQHHFSSSVFCCESRDLELYKNMKARGILLRLYAETSSVWLLVPPSEAWQDIMATLQWFIALFTTNELKSVQSFLHALEIDNIILNITLNIGGFLTTSPFTNPIFARRQEDVLDLCHKLLVHYLWQNPPAQDKLWAHFPFFQRCVKAFHMPSHIIHALLHNNVQICRELTKDFFEFIFDMIDQVGPSSELLDILITSSVCNQVPIYDNQLMISQLLMSPKRALHVLELYSQKIDERELLMQSPKCMDELNQCLLEPRLVMLAFTRKPLFNTNTKLGQKFCHIPLESLSFIQTKVDDALNNKPQDNLSRFLKHFKAIAKSLALREIPRLELQSVVQNTISRKGTIEYHAQPMLYYLKLLELLYSLTLGNNFICQGRLQRLIPIQYVIAALNSKSTLLPVKSKLLRVLNEGWLNTDQPIPSVASNLELMDLVCRQDQLVLLLFDDFSTEAYSTAQLFKIRYGHEITYVFESLVPVIKNYVEKYCQRNHLHRCIKRAIVDLLKLFYGLAHLLDVVTYKWSDILSVQMLHSTTNCIEILRQASAYSKEIEIFSFSTALLPLNSQPKPNEVVTESMESEDLLHLVFLDALLASEIKHHQPSKAITRHQEEKIKAKLAQTLGRLVHHAKKSEVCCGFKATPSTLECLELLKYLAISKPVIQPLLLTLGIVDMVVELYGLAHEKDIQCRQKLVCLSIALLRDTMHDAQIEFCKQLQLSKNHSWFIRVAQIIQGASEDQSSDDIECLLDFIQLMCKGHNLQNQNLMRHQSNSLGSVNLVAVIVSLFNRVIRTLSPKKMKLLKKIMLTIVELLQGPCESNQNTIVKTTSFIDGTMAILALSNTMDGYIMDDIYHIKYISTTALLSLLEHRCDTQMYSHLAEVISLRLLKQNMVDFYQYYLRTNNGAHERSKCDFYKRNWTYFKSLTNFAKNSIESRRQVSLSIGFNIYILFQQLLNAVVVDRSIILPIDLRTHDLKQIALSQNEPCSQTELGYDEAYSFFARRCASIEIVRKSAHGENHERFYFPKPTECNFLTKSMRSKVMGTIHYESATAKVYDLFDRADIIIREMSHRSIIPFNPDKWLLIVKALVFVLALAINLLLLGCYMDLTNESSPDKDHQIGCSGSLLGVSMELYIEALGYAHVIVSCILILLYILSFGPLILYQVEKAMKKQEIPRESTSSFDVAQLTSNSEDTKRADTRKINVLHSLLSLVQDLYCIYYIVYLIMSLLGNLLHPFFFCTHLFDLPLSFLDRNAIKTMFSSMKRLFICFVLIMLAEYVFSLIGFVLFRQQYMTQSTMSGLLWDCYLSIFDTALKSSRGMDAKLKEIATSEPGLWFTHFLFANSFNIIVVLILFNVFFGIIVDTLGDYRNRLATRQKNISGKCFICGISRESFDEISLHEYEKHIKQDHNLWHYVFLVAHLQCKSKDALDGTEQYLWESIQKQDYTFVPLHRAIALQNR